MKVIGIAGGSGSSKSTVAYGLADLYSDTYEVISLDNYQKIKKEPGFPELHGMPNWDHPDVVEWSRLRDDIIKLRDGQKVTTKVWNHRSNPDFYRHKQMKELVLMPKPVVVVEGHLALNETLMDLYDKTIFLDLDEKTRNQRRAAGRTGKGFIGTTEDYITKVLAPMHQQYVEPAKATADIVIDMGGVTTDEAVKVIHNAVHKV
jgi:uridine kinase